MNAASWSLLGIILCVFGVLTLICGLILLALWKKRTEQHEMEEEQ